ncbi:MAG: glycosyltransferase [Proteobacteria bacterium]|nr:glycosyltransferase [Pseudomonadota bacterium]MBU1714513.1 glycosyltransferase [Pseudomonadota bacterium]
MRKKLIVFTSTFPRWKDDTDPPFVYELSRRLVSDFEVHVLAPNYPGALRAETMDGMEVHRFRYFWSCFEKLAGSSGILPTLKKNKLYYLLIPFFIMAEFLALLKLVRKIKPDVVHAHWLIPQGIIAAIVKKITGTPYLVTAHGGDVFGLQGGLFGFLKRFSLDNADQVTVVSSVIKQVVLGISDSKVVPVVLPMGVDPRKFELEEDNGLIRVKYGVKGPFLLFVGRLTEKKGVGYLLEAMPEIISRVPDLKLLVIGSGEEEENLKQLSDSLNIGGNVIFAGSIPNRDLPQFYGAADIFIGPSIRAKGGDTEGFGLTFVEAGMSGCILIGSKVGGITDIIKDGETGFLIEEKNPAALAGKVLEVVGLKNEWPEIRKRNRQVFVDNFGLDVIAEKYAQLLADVGDQLN